MIYHTFIDQEAFPKLNLRGLCSSRHFSVLDSRRMLICPVPSNGSYLVPDKQFILYAPYEDIALMTVQTMHRGRWCEDTLPHCGFGSEVATGIYHPAKWGIRKQLTESLLVFISGAAYYFVDLDQRRVVKRTLRRDIYDGKQFFAGGTNEPLYMYLVDYSYRVTSVFNISEVMDSGEPDGELIPSHFIRLQDGESYYDPVHRELWWFTSLKNLSKLFRLPAEETIILPSHLYTSMPEEYMSISRIPGHIIIQIIYQGGMKAPINWKKHCDSFQFRILMIPHIAANEPLPSDIEISDLILDMPSDKQCLNKGVEEVDLPVEIFRVSDNEVVKET